MADEAIAYIHLAGRNSFPSCHAAEFMMHEFLLICEGGSQSMCLLNTLGSEACQWKTDLTPLSISLIKRREEQSGIDRFLLKWLRLARNTRKEAILLSFLSFHRKLFQIFE